MNWEKLLSNQRRGQKKVAHTPSRSAFEQDYDRIIFSHPFRRLQDKTQVHPLPEHDFVHTRLTHSLEVSSVGRSLGKLVGNTLMERYPDLKNNFSAHDFGAIVAAAALTHDIGNPPFGHAGEDALSEFFSHGSGQRYQDNVSKEEWEDLTNFEGNAQGFRILNKERYQGLKLTFATLASFTKYPRPALFDRDPKRRSQKKFGFFQTELEVYREIADQCNLKPLGTNAWARHPLAFLVEAADDICYNLIDLEDGCRLGFVSYDETVNLFANILKESFNKEKLERIDSIDERISTLRALSIGKLIEECTELFLDNEQAILTADYDISLTDDIPSASLLEEVVNISIEKIYRSRLVMETEAAGYEVLPGLMEVFSEAIIETNSGNKRNKYKSILRLLPSEIRHELTLCNSKVYLQLMVCVDFVSGLTDTHAISLFRKIKGISHPNI